MVLLGLNWLRIIFSGSLWYYRLHGSGSVTRKFVFQLIFNGSSVTNSSRQTT